ncbi:Fasciclin-like arabinogalactan protein [Vigna angularis]|uniref:Fasciclin-like arabinogalactan protein n=1 Tax=Phaseolus angularis TaxID=3914 RepID=A0A8T0KZ40_PHAAN|nr:Fasciclin-like arabinogalactan protein [Vigna angularis]
MRDPQSGLVSIRSPLTSSQTSSFCPSSKPYPILCHHLRHQFPSHPYDLDLMTSEICLNIVLNITKAVIDGHNFNVIASMLAASGVVQAVLEFEADEGDAGITFFVPVDDAFADLPPYVALQSLHVDKKGVVLKFHVLHSYYPLGSLESVVNPFQPTLATEAMGAGSFTLNISRLNGSISINTDIVQTSVTQTVFDQNLLSFLGFPRWVPPRRRWRTQWLKKVKGKNKVCALKQLGKLVDSHLSTRKTVEENNELALISSLLCPFTSHTVGLEAIGILVNLDLGLELKRNLMQSAKVSLLVDIMNEGTIQTKMNCTKLIQWLLVEGNPSKTTQRG